MAEAEGMRRGVRIGVDVGSVRVGVARSDRDGLLATPVATLPGGSEGLRQLLDLITDEEAIEVIVGLPRSLSGAEGHAARIAREYAGTVADGTEVPVRVVDERLTTVSAHGAMHAAGRRGRKHREVVDQVAAVMILQHALDIERNTKQVAGELIPPRQILEES